MRVLITGAGGEVARGVLPFLDKKFDLSLLSLEPPGDDPRSIADILDRNALARAMKGIDAVLHLAVASGHSGVFEDDAFNDLRFDVNVKGTYHVFEAAWRARVKRVVHVSSVMVSWGHGMRKPRALIPGDAQAMPVGTYALTKAAAEEVARYYGLGLHQIRNRRSRRTMAVLVVRISAPLDLNSPTLRTRPVRPQQIPFPDLAGALEKALTRPVKKFAIVTVVGESSRRMWDLACARKILHYRPQYKLDDLGVTFADPFDV